MRKYADIYGGVVRDIQATELDFMDFAAIWEPTTYWIDVTDRTDVEVGYSCRFDPQQGAVFEKPVERTEYDELEYRKNEKLANFKDYYNSIAEDAHVMSSLGFEVNSNTTAAVNVAELLLTSSDTDTIQYRDYNNLTHTVTYEGLQTLQKEIAQSIIDLRHQKWVIQGYIEAAESLMELSTISFDLTMMNFLS